MPQGDAQIRFVGTVGQDPETREVGGATVTSLSVAVTNRVKSGDDWVDGNTTWFRCSVWRQLGENVAASIHKGDRVQVEGTIAERKYTTREGEERTSWDVNVDQIGVSLQFATAVVTRGGAGSRQPRGGQRPPAGNGNMEGRSGPQGSPRQAPARQDPGGWAAAPGAYDDETPF